MPTVILLDVSLSMLRPVSGTDGTEEYQRRHLAIHGIGAFLDHLSANSKLEFVSLIIFSSLWEQLVPFTRDYDIIKAALDKTENFDKTFTEAALAAAGSVITEEWGSTSSTPAQVILVTDGSTGIGSGSLKHSLQTLHDRTADDTFPLPFQFPCKLHVVPIVNQSEANLQTTLNMYQKLIDLNNQGGQLFLPEGALSLKSVQTCFTKMAEQCFTPLYAVLQCGHLQCNVQVYPLPQPYHRQQDFKNVHKTVNEVISICGFLDSTDVASPPFISRHLVLPRAITKEESHDKEESKADGKDEDEDGTEEGKTPSFTVLLHGSLKVEGMVALVEVSEDWYGMLYSWADSKKKSNLMLSIFEPGTDVLPWLGELDHLSAHSSMLFPEPPYGFEDNRTPFPVRPQDRRSYAQNCVVWIKATGLQSDIQKILRHARKLPEKQQQFYKELNRVRKAALSLGFMELLEALSTMLDRECTLLPGTAHPDAALQLSHAANSLRSDNAKEYSQNILPLSTNFSGE
ncbi:integrator complex subunit 14 [Lingula anatina]|uniref:Integrator complex subunit 14 n=1 Tax=Lingula anatina TaxID=7574 RepID=A0A1S3IZP5_LINAN|nr:integrator complex subunit 14 [Lingula anatina]XP_013403666.1 integrator complex subunit 14 [Lingula anatina]|eukprot:XP_013403665.1 integrator complex subunit 14 [Lingula anatina]